MSMVNFSYFNPRCSSFLTNFLLCNTRLKKNSFEFFLHPRDPKSVSYSNAKVTNGGWKILSQAGSRMDKRSLTSLQQLFLPILFFLVVGAWNSRVCSRRFRLISRQIKSLWTKGENFLPSQKPKLSMSKNSWILCASRERLKQKGVKAATTKSWRLYHYGQFEYHSSKFSASLMVAEMPFEGRKDFRSIG